MAPHDSGLPAILVHCGPEEGEKSRAYESVKTRIEKTAGEVEEYRLYGFEVSAAQILDLLRGSSLFGGHNLIRVVAAEQLKSKSDITALIDYVKDPASGSTLVLESSEVRIDDRLERAVGSQNKKIFWEMFEEQKANWVRGYVRRHGAEIDEEATSLLLELVENNTRELQREIDRLLAFGGTAITADEIERYVYHARGESVFSLFDAVVKEELERALDIAGKLVVTESAGSVISGLYWQFNRLLTFHRLRAHGLDDGVIFGKTHLNMRSKRAQGAMIAAARSYPYGAVREIVLSVGNAETLLRTIGTGWQGIIVDLCVYSVVSTSGSWSVPVLD